MAITNATTERELEAEIKHHTHNKNAHSRMRSDWQTLTDEQKTEIARDEKHAGCYDCCLCQFFTAFGYCSGIKLCCCHLNGAKAFLGIEKENRHTTDVPCCLGFLAALIVQFYLFYIAAFKKKADPLKLLYFADWEGNLCAPGDKYPAGNYAAWPDIRITDIIICVDTCNDTLNDSRIVTPPFNFDSSQHSSQDLLNLDFTGYESTLVFGAYCVPNPESIKNAVVSMKAEYEKFTSAFDSVGDSVSMALNDVVICKYLFIATAFMTLFFSLIWGKIIRHCGGLIVWLSLLFTILGVILIAYYLITYSGFVRAFGYTVIADIMYYTGIALAVLDVLFTFGICFMWERIKLAIAIVKEATRALNSLLALFIYPIVPFFTFCAYIAYWIVVAVYMGSVIKYVSKPIPEGQKIPYYTVGNQNGPTLYETLGYQTTYRTREVKQKWQYALLFHFFCLLWVSYYISYHTYMVVCGVYAEWYFADWENAKEEDKKRGDKDNELSRCPVGSSWYRATRYHMGTIAFASLLIAIIEFIDNTLSYFEKQFLSAQESPLKKFVLACIKCLLKCLKCILNRINRNGLTITSIYGWPFCAASIKGILIVMKNIIRATAMEMVSGYLEKLGGIAIVACTTGVMMIITYFTFGDGNPTGDKYLSSRVSSLTSPGIIYCIISILVCWQFMHLYEVGLRTIFICFLIDEERNKQLNEMKASKALRDAIGAAAPKRYQLVNKAKSYRAKMIRKEQRKHFAGLDHTALNKADYQVLSKSTRLLPIPGTELAQLKASNVGDKENSKSSSHSGSTVIRD